MRTKPFVPIVRLIVVPTIHEYQLNYTYDCIREFKYNNSGSAQGQLAVPDISSFGVITPKSEVITKYQKITYLFSESAKFKKFENKKLEKLKNLLLSKLATIEN